MLAFGAIHAESEGMGTEKCAFNDQQQCHAETGGKSVLMPRE